MRTFRLRTPRAAMLTALAACVCLLIAPGPAAADAILSLTPSLTTVLPGDTFTIDVEITGALDVYGWQVDVSFDPAVINILSTMEGAFLTSGGVTTFFINGTLDNGTGLVDNMAATRTGPVAGVNGNGLLATLSFQAMGVGLSSVTLGNVILADSADQPLTVGLSSATVVVTPEPGAALLLLSGLGGLAALRRKPKKRKP